MTIPATSTVIFAGDTLSSNTKNWYNICMIADFPNIKNKLNDAADRLLQASIKKHAPFLNMVGKRMIFEGEELNYIRENGEKTSMTFKASEQSFSLTKEELSK